MRSPIKSPLGKTSAHNQIEKLIPRGKIVSSYTFYSGDIEFYLSSRNRFVNCKSTKRVVVDFWESMCYDSSSISDLCAHLFPLKDDKEIKIVQENWFSFKSPESRAAIFYIFNNCTKDGWISRGELDLSLLNPLLISRIKRFTKPDNIHLTHIENIKKDLSEDTMSDFVFFRLPKIQKNFLTDGLNIGIEEQTINLEDIYDDLMSRKFIILTRPSKFINFKQHETIFLDQHGRRTTEDNAKEIILHNA